MKRLYAVLFVLAVCLTFIAPPAMATERWVYPTDEWLRDPVLLYEYGIYGQSSEDVGVRLVFWLRPDFWPDWLALEADLPNGHWVAQNIDLHDIDDELLPPAGYVSANNDRWGFEQKLRVGWITEPGLHEFHLLLSGEGGKHVFADYEVDLPSFDFYEGVCNLDRHRVAIEYSVFSLEPLPPTVEEVTVEYRGRTYTFSDVPFVGGNEHFGWIRLPLTFHSRLYDRLLGGKYLTTTMTINGEVVVWEKGMLYPASSHARYTCERG